MTSNYPYQYTPQPGDGGAARHDGPADGSGGYEQYRGTGYDPSYEPTVPPPAVVYGQPTYDAYGRPLYDSYGRAQYGAPSYGQYPTGQYPTQPYGYAPYQPHPHYLPPAPQPGRNRATRRWVAGLGAAVIAAALVVGGVTLANNNSSSTVSGSGANNGVLPGGTGSGGGSTGGGSTGTFPGSGGGSTGSGSGSGTASATIATATQIKGLVTVVSVLGYQNAESAGTGMILTSNGEILTNNHVIDGATSITVTDETTGTQYKAKVVGTDATDDVAVLQLSGASGLTTAKIGNSSGLSVGDSVVGVGNAGGTGTLRASAGKVTALDQSITATDETGANSERLHGLIGVDADIISGDSGGAMYDSSGDIIGMNTAASTSPTTSTSAYAIPIDSALSIADKIESGVESSTIHQGLPGFIGVQAEDANGKGAYMYSVVANGPASSAGITAGSVITKVDGTTITSATGLKSALEGKKPGTSVSLTWTGTAGNSHTATVTLGTGPAD